MKTLLIHSIKNSDSWRIKSFHKGNVWSETYLQRSGVREREGGRGEGGGRGGGRGRGREREGERV